jgi:DNA polymerase
VSPRVTVCQAVVYLDFETRNTGGCDLTKAGAWRYAADPATEILVAGYRSAGCDEAQAWRPADGCDEPLATLAADPAVRFVCFSDFDIAIWDRIMTKRHGFPPILLARWDNAQATAAYLALPRSLDGVLQVRRTTGQG